MRVDSTQWPTAKIVASANNWLDRVTGFAIGADHRFQWDDTNHTELPEATTNLVANQSDYSFLTDEQGNTILTLVRVDMLQTSGGSDYIKLELIDQSNIPYALDEFYGTAGTPAYYDKIADNIVRLYPKPSTNITNGLKLYFKRTPSYFTASDTTKAPGVAPILHRGFVIAAAYDGALTLGLENLQALSVEMEKEERKMRDYFTARNHDASNVMTPKRIDYV